MPVSPAYSLLSSDFAKLRSVMQLMVTAPDHVVVPIASGALLGPGPGRVTRAFPLDNTFPDQQRRRFLMHLPHAGGEGRKVDLLIAPYGTVPTAPIMPLVKQRGLLLMGNFSFQVNAKVQHDMWFNNAPWNDASSWSDGFFRAGQRVGAKSVAVLAADNDFAQNLANVSTTGFRADLARFEARPVEGPGYASRVNTVATGLGVDRSQGALVQTGEAQPYANFIFIIGSK